jgi:hypothetical protein
MQLIIFTEIIFADFYTGKKHLNALWGELQGV